MRNKHLMFAGLALVLTSIALKLFEVEWYFVVLFAGILLKIIYLVKGLLSGRLAGGRYLALLFSGIVLVGAGGYLSMSQVVPLPEAFWIMGTGFMIKALSIVLMVVVGRKRRMKAEKLMS